LFQHNFIENYKNNILDLVISDNNGLEVSKCSFALIKIDRANPPLQRNDPVFVPTLRSKTFISEFNFHCANFNAMNINFNNID
jgi:hypothetical protein